MSAETISWLKLPIVGCPGLDCGKALDTSGEVVDTDFPTCGEPARWMAGEMLFCQEHAATIAEEYGDTIEAIEAAWLAQSH